MAEQHFLARLGWLRAAVLGANDGILSTAGLVLGVCAAGASAHGMLIAGLAAWIAGACSMAVGEYVSVSAQADTEKTAIAQEQSLLDRMKAEDTDLNVIYHVTSTDGLGNQVSTGEAVHLADPQAVLRHIPADAAKELGLTEDTKAKPLEAAIASAASFSIGSLFPLAFVIFAPTVLMTFGLVCIATLFSLAGLGAAGALLSGANWRVAVTRVTLLGFIAICITVGLGVLAGHVIG